MVIFRAFFFFTFGSSYSHIVFAMFYLYNTHQSLSHSECIVIGVGAILEAAVFLRTGHFCIKV